MKDSATSAAKIPVSQQATTEVIAKLAEALQDEYQTPDLGNKEDPLEELVFITLTNRVVYQNYTRTWERLVSKFPTWPEMAHAEESEIASAVGLGGLGQQKAKTIKTALQCIYDAFGEYSLERLRTWRNEKIVEFLRQIPGMGLKSAKCVMMYSLGRDVFPIDTHVRRVLDRLGLIQKVDKWSDEQIEGLVKPGLRYSLHVNLVYHGQHVCRPRWPKCGECFLLKRCSFAQNQIAVKKGEKE